MNGPAVQYANGSGVEIAYQVLGEGPVDIVWVGGAMTHLERTHLGDLVGPNGVRLCLVSNRRRADSVNPLAPPPMPACY
jgi:hypothetical protein